MLAKIVQHKGLNVIFNKSYCPILSVTGDFLNKSLL